MLSRSIGIRAHGVHSWGVSMRAIKCFSDGIGTMARPLVRPLRVDSMSDGSLYGVPRTGAEGWQ